MYAPTTFFLHFSFFIFFNFSFCFIFSFFSFFHSFHFKTCSDDAARSALQRLNCEKRPMHLSASDWRCPGVSRMLLDTEFAWCCVVVKAVVDGRDELARRSKFLFKKHVLQDRVRRWGDNQFFCQCHSAGGDTIPSRNHQSEASLCNNDQHALRTKW